MVDTGLEVRLRAHEKNMNKGGGDSQAMELRASLEYYNFYHSQPAEAGLAPPIYDWGEQGGPPADALAAAPASKGRGGGIQRQRGGMRKTDGGGGEGEENWAGEVGQVGLMLDELSVGDSADETTLGSAGASDWSASGAFPNNAEGHAAFLHKSIIDRIQEDFPRTPSPVFALNGTLLLPGAKPAHAKALPSPSSKGVSSPQMSEGDGDNLGSQPASGGTSGGLSPLQSPSALAPVIESASLPPAAAANAAAPGYAGGGAGLLPMAGNSSYTIDTSHMPPQQQQQHMLQHQHQHQHQHQNQNQNQQQQQQQQQQVYNHIYGLSSVKNKLG